MESLLPRCVPDGQVHLPAPHCDLLVHEGCLQDVSEAVQVVGGAAHLQGGLVRARGTHL